METSVTKPIEEIVNTVSGIDELRSTTKEGDLGRQRRSSSSRRTATWPSRRCTTRSTRSSRSCRPGPTRRSSTSSTSTPSPVMTIAVSGKRVAARGHRDRRQADQGAAQQPVRRRRGDPGRRPQAGHQRHRRHATSCEAYDLSIEDVRQALAAQNLELPGGRVDQDSPRAGAAHHGPGRGARAVQRPDRRQHRNGQPVRITRHRPRRGLVSRSRARSAGSTARTPCLVVQKQSGTNTVEVIDTVKATARRSSRRPSRRAARPTFAMEVIRDQSRFINSVDPRGQVAPAPRRACWSR